MSKVFERILYKQMSHMNDLLPNYITGFRKLLGSQHCLVKILENWENALDRGDSICVLCMGLSKAFDTINDHLLLEKFKA